MELVSNLVWAGYHIPPLPQPDFPWSDLFVSISPFVLSHTTYPPTWCIFPVGSRPAYGVVPEVQLPRSGAACRCWWATKTSCGSPMGKGGSLAFTPPSPMKEAIIFQAAHKDERNQVLIGYPRKLWLFFSNIHLKQPQRFRITRQPGGYTPSKSNSAFVGGDLDRADCVL